MDGYTYRTGAGAGAGTLFEKGKKEVKKEERIEKEIIISLYPHFHFHSYLQCLLSILVQRIPCPPHMVNLIVTIPPQPKHHTSPVKT